MVDAPIPQPQPDDDEDVNWALSTASALWGRGECVEAIKWLRRAAEQASDANADMRALELFKAAAELAGRVNTNAPPAPTPSAPRPSEGAKPISAPASTAPPASPTGSRAPPPVP